MDTFLICLIGMLLFLSSQANEDELVYVLEYSRHGARLPRLLLADWNSMPMSLTPAGMRQHYILGRALRSRYVLQRQFLSTKYCPTEVALHSSNLSRCIASATAQMMGLYPPGTGRELWIGDEVGTPPSSHNYRDWVHQLNRSSLVHMLNTFPVSTNLRETMVWQYACPGMKSFINVDRDDAAVREKYGDYLDALARAFNISANISLSYASSIRDVLICGLYEGRYVQDEEFTRGLIENTSVVFDLRKHVYYLNATYRGTRVSRVVASPFLGRVRSSLGEALAAHRAGNRSARKMDVFVGSDTYLQSIMMELMEVQYPSPFASVLLFELYKNKTAGTDEYYVRLLYNKELNITLPIAELMSRLDASILPESEYDSLCELGDRLDGRITVEWRLFLQVSAALCAGMTLMLWAVYAMSMRWCKKGASEEQLRLTRNVS